MMFRTIAAALWVAAVAGCGAPPEPALPAEPVAPAALEREMRDVQVVMFMTEWCPHCRRARAWLKKRRYNFLELDVERDSRAAAMLQSLNPRGSVPLFDVEGQILVGFDPHNLHAAILRALERRTGAGNIGFAAPLE